MLHRLGLPYMGSKRLLAERIVDFILKKNPNTRYLYDLFGGGGAVSFEAVQRPNIKKVIYNELNIGVVNLLKKVLTDGVTDEMYQWVDRKTFFEHKDDDDWFGGLCKVVWSFGNDQKSYLFGRNIENYKKLLHDIIVNRDEKALKEFKDKFGVEIDESNKKMYPETIQDRRLRIAGQIKKVLKQRTELEHFDRLQQIERMYRLENLEQLCQLQKIQQLQQLQHLERLNQLEQIKYLNGKLLILNKSYDDVKINTDPSETVIYLDPPYKGTNEYQLRIDYDNLYTYIRNSKYKIYLSSYDAPFKCVKEFNHRSTLCATNNSKRTIEKLFVNEEV